MLKILECEVFNFASYRHYKFDFSSNNFKILTGPTGSGKSTLCDMIPWCLFGRTAKGGNADEVRPWGVEESTKGNLILFIRDRTIYITRIRGSSNDLYFSIDGGESTRGSNLKDTQHKLQELVEIDFDTYILSSYINEFSPITNFFNTTAKNRRAIFENLLNLDDLVSLQKNIAECKKDTKIEIEDLNRKFVYLNREFQTATNLHESLKLKETELIKELETSSKEEQDELLKKLKSKYVKTIKNLGKEREDLLTSLENNDALDRKIVEINGTINFYKTQKCSSCGASTKTNEILILTKELNDINLKKLSNFQSNKQILKIEKDIERADKVYKIEKSEILAKIANPINNPYPNLINSKLLEISSIKNQIRGVRVNIEDSNEFLHNLTLVLNIIEDVRELKTSNLINYLQDRINEILTTYFTSDISVILELEGQDSLEINIYKDGNLCFYSQLSKGQRQLLKLSLSISVFSYIKNYLNKDINTLFLDEALDGLSEDLKLKSYRLFESLSVEYEHLFIVDHSLELKTIFDQVINIQLIDGKSHATI